jgi:hypothetical protein
LLTTANVTAQAREINESSDEGSDEQQDAAGSKQDQSSHQQQQQQPEGEAAGSEPSTAESPTAQKQTAAAADAPAGSGDEETLEQHGSSSGSSIGGLFAGDRKLVWLGVAVGAVVVVAIVQLAFATFWQPPKAGPSGGGAGVLSRHQQPYQAVGTSDDQELAELSERGQLVPQNAGQSIHSSQPTVPPGG